MEPVPTVDGVQPAPTPMPVRHRHVPTVVIAILAALIGVAVAYALLSDSWPFRRAEPLLSPAVSPSAPADTTAGWKAYLDQSSGFEFKYPQTFSEPQGTVDTRTVTFTHEGLPPETNAREVTLTLRMSDDPEQVCTGGLRPGSVPEAVDVHSQLWYHDSFGDAGAGNFYFTHEYHTFNEGTCYKLAMNVHTVNPDAFPEETRPEVFDPQPLWDQLRQVVFTFRFFGSSAGWRTFTSNQYGFELRYPPEYQHVTDGKGWERALVLLYNGGQSYDIAVEVWDDENGFTETYHEMPDIIREIDAGRWLTVWNISDEAANEQILATLKFSR